MNDIGTLFQNAGVEGTFDLYDTATGTLQGYNKDRAHTRLVPASTFKIPNTLIALSVKAVGSTDEIVPYGGKPQPFAVWEQDMAIREAIMVSNVPVYQEIARRIGNLNMQKYLTAFGYGNETIGESVDTFWLEGPLKISAIEQLVFLGKLVQGQLPVASSIVDLLRDIIEMDRGTDWILYGKTGWENAPEPGIGWYTGWIEKADTHYLFALNIDIIQVSDARLRSNLLKLILNESGFISP